MSTIIKAPNEYEEDGFKVFLAGTIDNGDSIDWQKHTEEYLGDLDITILNPRRNDWDLNTKSTIDNPDFRKQVEWELDALSNADLIFFYFAPHSKSPITLLELGLYAEGSNIVLVCPEEFWRKGNVDIVAKRYGISVFENLESGLALVRTTALWELE